MAKRKTAFFSDLVADLDFHLTAQDVRKIIGVDAGSFQQWLAREIIPFETVAAGKRTWRRFHVREVPRLVLISTIWNNGLLISDAVQIADLIFKGDGKVEPELIVYFRPAGAVHLLDPGDSDPSDLFGHYRVASCLVIQVAELKKHVEAALLMARRVRQSAAT